MKKNWRRKQKAEKHLAQLPTSKVTLSWDPNSTHVLPTVKKKAAAEPIMRRDKVEVFVRVIFCKLSEISTINESFTADVFIQARWREPKFDSVHEDEGLYDVMCKRTAAIDWDQYWTPGIYIGNVVNQLNNNIWRDVELVRNDKRSETDGRDVLEAFVYERRQLKATFLENMELEEFPFDTQDITVTIVSDRDQSELVFREETQDDSVDPKSFVCEREWKLCNRDIDVKSDTLDKIEEGSRRKHPYISYRCHASRRFGFYVWSFYFFMFFVCCLGFATFAIGYTLVQNRLQVSFILLLTMITFKFTANQSLPKISYLTYLDKYILSSVATLCSICVWHALIGSAITYAYVGLANLDKYLLAFLGSSYLLGHIIFISFIWIRLYTRERSMHKERNPLKDQEGVSVECLQCFQHCPLTKKRSLSKKESYAPGNSTSFNGSYDNSGFSSFSNHRATDTAV